MVAVGTRIGFDPADYPHLDPITRAVDSVSINPGKLWRERAWWVRGTVSLPDATGCLTWLHTPRLIEWTGDLFSGGAMTWVDQGKSIADWSIQLLAAPAQINVWNWQLTISKLSAPGASWSYQPSATINPKETFFLMTFPDFTTTGTVCGVANSAVIKGFRYWETITLDYTPLP